MSVNAGCGKCEEPLKNNTLTKDDGSTDRVSECPNDPSKIKSPMCCRQYMAYTRA